MSDLAIEPNSLWERCLLDDIQNRSKRRVMRLEWWIMRSERFASAVANNSAIATSRGSNGRPLIFRAVEYHEEVASQVLSNNKLTSIRDDQGVTVAHAIAIFHKKLAERIVAERSDLCAMKTIKGLTVELFARITLSYPI